MFLTTVFNMFNSLTLYTPALTSHVMLVDRVIFFEYINLRATPFARMQIRALEQVIDLTKGAAFRFG